MYSGPSKTAEAIVAVFVPPACREEVLGDLHERYCSPGQYGLDALRTIPLVMASRIRRTSDPQVLLMQALALYASFVGAAWLWDETFFGVNQWGLLLLSIPPAMAMLGLILDDAYATHGPRSPMTVIRGPVLGLGLALTSQGIARISNPDLALPGWIVFYGCAISLLASSTVRIFFPAAADQLKGTNVPADWLKQSGGSLGNPGTSIGVLRRVATIATVVFGGTWIANRAAPPKLRIIALLLVMLIAYQIWKRG
jgi:hypothetical protein